MGEVFHEQPDRRSMRDDFWSHGHQKRFATAENNFDCTQPIPQVRQNFFPLVHSGSLLLSSILPNVAVDTSSVAPFRQENDDRCRLAMRCPDTSSQSPQSE